MSECLGMLQKHDNFRMYTKRAKTSTVQAFNALTYDHEEISAYVYIEFKNLASLKGLRKQSKLYDVFDANIPEERRPHLRSHRSLYSRKVKYKNRKCKMQNKKSKMERKMTNLGRMQ